MAWHQQNEYEVTNQEINVGGLCLIHSYGLNLLFEKLSAGRDDETEAETTVLITEMMVKMMMIKLRLFRFDL